MTIGVLTLLPLIAALASAYLAWIAMTSDSRDTVTTRLFALLNLSIVAWSAGYFVQLNYLGGLEPSLAPLGTPAYVLFCVITVGVAGAPTCWFLFAASYAGKRFWMRSSGRLIASLPLFYTMAVAFTNPLHHLFVAGPAPVTGFSYGPLALPHQIMTLALVVGGIWMITAALWRRRAVSGRLQAVTVLVASTLPLVGGVVWGTRVMTGIPLTVNPTPLGFAMLAAALSYLVIKGGFGDIVPVAASQALRTMADGIVVVDRAGIVVAMNPAAEHLVPRARIGSAIADVLPQGSRVGEPGAGPEDYVEYESQLAEGTYWIRIRTTRDRARIPIGHVIFLTDITELRTTQDELARLNDRLRLHVTALEEAHRETERRRFALERANWELRVATQAKSRLLANMSHELRTPLNSIIGFTGVMLQGLPGDLNEEQRTQLKMANDSGQHLLHLINDILDLSKVESGSHRLRASRVRLDDMIESVASTISPLVEEKGLALVVRNGAPGLEFMSDPLRVRQVLLNLLGNAVKFTEQGSITLSAEARPSHLEFSVRDEGVGISSHDLGRVFHPFEQVVGDSGTKPEGTGLGLSISREIAQALGGALAVESEPGRGSLFTLTLPLDPGSEGGGESAERAAGGDTL